MSPSANPSPNRVTTLGTWATRGCLYQKGGSYTKTHSWRPDNGALLQVLCHCLRIGSLFGSLPIATAFEQARLLVGVWELQSQDLRGLGFCPSPNVGSI